MYRFLSVGAGVQSSALAIIEPFDEFIFADTGAEKPETYAFIEQFLKPYAASRGIPFTIVRKMRRVNGELIPENIVEYCLRTRNIPSIRYRWSTHDFKIRPMQKYIRATHGGELPVRCAIGISTDEVERAKVRRNLPEWEVEYPLLERGLSRKDSERILLREWGTLPIKSGCYICPFQSDAQWRDLHEVHPDLYEVATQVEANARLWRPTITFNGKNETLTDLTRRFTMRLDSFAEKPCDGGYCLV